MSVPTTLGQGGKSRFLDDPLAGAVGGGRRGGVTLVDNGIGKCRPLVDPVVGSLGGGRRGGITLVDNGIGAGTKFWGDPLAAAVGGGRRGGITLVDNGIGASTNSWGDQLAGAMGGGRQHGIAFVDGVPRRRSGSHSCCGDCRMSTSTSKPRAANEFNTMAGRGPDIAPATLAPKSLSGGCSGQCGGRCIDKGSCAGVHQDLQSMTGTQGDVGDGLDIRFEEVNEQGDLGLCFPEVVGSPCARVDGLPRCLRPCEFPFRSARCSPLFCNSELWSLPTEAQARAETDGLRFEEGEHALRKLIRTAWAIAQRAHFIWIAALQCVGHPLVNSALPGVLRELFQQDQKFIWVNRNTEPLCGTPADMVNSPGPAERLGCALT